MNGEQSSSRFYELDRETMQVVVQYQPLYELYTRALGSMHDLICEFTDSLEKPQFTPAQVDEMMARMMQQIHELDLTTVKPTSIERNVAANYRAALTIRAKAERSETPNERVEGERSAEQFLHSLLAAYTTLRLLKKHSIPAQP